MAGSSPLVFTLPSSRRVASSKAAPRPLSRAHVNTNTQKSWPFIPDRHPKGFLMQWPFMGGKPYLRLRLKTGLSTQLEADISRIPTLGWKINASCWRNTSVPTFHSLPLHRQLIHNYTHIRSPQVPLRTCGKSGICSNSAQLVFNKPILWRMFPYGHISAWLSVFCSNLSCNVPAS